VLASCSKREPPPTCEAIGRHAQAQIRANHGIDVTKLLRMPPWDPQLTQEDRAYVKRACANWPEDYRRCVLATSGDRVRCGSPYDSEWRELPHIRDWRALLKQEQNFAAVLAAKRAVATSAETTRLREALDKATAKADRDRLTTQLLDAAGAGNDAVMLAHDCQDRALEKAACVALLPAKRPE